MDAPESPPADISAFVRALPPARRRALRDHPDGLTQNTTLPLADTVAVQDVLGEIADQLGIRVVEGPTELP